MIAETVDLTPLRARRLHFLFRHATIDVAAPMCFV
jgi:hypothetical protein